MFFGGIVEPMTSNNELPRESSSNFPLPTSLPVTSEANAIRKEVIHNYFETAEASDGGEEPTLSDSDSDFDDSDANSPPSVPLYPFQNQVGGHASLLRFSERALCKPLMKHEKAMYEHFETETPEILPFISSYLGVINVTFAKQDDEVTPVVLFEKNQHILPDDILKRFLSSSVPSEEAHTESPGVTKVNKKLQEQIFHEACSPRSGRRRIRNHSSKRAERRRPKQSLRRHSFSESNSELAKPPSKPSLLQVKKSDVRLISSFESDHPPYDTSDEELVNNRLDKIKISAQVTPGAPTATSKGVSVEEDSLLFHMEDIEEALPGNSLLPSLTPCAPTPPLNPWSMEVYRSTMDKMATSSTSNASHQFLLINDLTYKMQKPCVLDLKMGTRQYGIYASKEKRESQMRKM
ncbi:inositol polyphosphate kinase kcs1 [Entomophthora muscae]|uniref:Inositol polyphosphate kinase kcs1 n=1 Tax=Entomophthora muscae TaxID=34485 RepID=A0ACC2TAC0_9FUNG|nr:inositol polyphosphate kinase kcs1 [Entomophthora muscae]